MKWIRLLLTALFFIVSCFILPTGMSKISAVSLIVSSESHDLLKIYPGQSSRNPAFSEEKASELLEMPVESQKKLIFRFPSQPATTWLRIDPGEHPGVTKIYEMVVQQALGRRLHFDAADIYNGFRAGREGVELSLEGSYVAVRSAVEDPFLVSKAGFISKPRPFFFYLPVVILTFFFYYFLSKLDQSTMRTVFLPGRKLRPGIKAIAPLDGLRGFAALLVVADHTWPLFLGAGASGVSIFFVLSGFLLCRPFVLNPQKMFRKDNLIRYGARRLQRILPMYYLYLFLTFGLAFRLYDFFLHLFFIEALGHLWAIPQEMAFYTVFPLILLVNCYLFRNRLWTVIPGVLGMMFLWHEYVTKKDIYLYGMMHTKLPFRLDVFLVGVLCSYLFFGIWEKMPRREMYAMVKNILLVVAVALLALFLFFSNGHYLHNSKIYAQIYYLNFAISAGVVILILASSGENILTKLFSSSFLSSLGIVSYSFYLFHPLVIQFVKHTGGSLVANGGVRFVIVSLLSYILACLLYYFIERPLLGMYEKRSK